MSENRGVPPTSLDDVAKDAADDIGIDAAGTTTRPARRTARAARAPEPDAACAAAVDLARAAAEEDAEPGTVGAHLGVTAEGERLVTHAFAALAKGYRGWRWAVTVARAPRSRTVTVCEVVLLPGTDAILPPAWVPWQERIAPGDLGPADVLPYRADDPFLAPGYSATDEEDEDHAQLWELGLGRVRVLSLEGREAAATRWYTGNHGPTAEEALHAAAPCSTCGFFLPLAGGLRRAFGVCGNEWSPSDGRVVSVDHGCGAHSETDVEVPEPMPLPEPILDETGAEAVALPPRRQPADAALVETSPVEIAPVEARPAETALVETALVEAALVEAALVEAALVEAAPVDAVPVDAVPVEAVPVEAVPVEAVPAETE
jgi:hypothetical protein